jgi:hypothetical protein
MEITSAVIAGIATILSAIITLFLTEYLGRRKERFIKVSDAIKRTVSGTWKGKYDQILRENPVTVDLIIELTVSTRGKITGTATVPYGEDTFVVNIRGGFYSIRFLKMEYENSNDAILQFGSFVFKLSDDAKEIEGHFVGYGHISKKIIGGPAILKKV